MADRPNLPYTDAVIHEIQRHGNILPLGFPKMASKDSMLGGYFIPKVMQIVKVKEKQNNATSAKVSFFFPQGTVISAILSSVLFDESEWENPHAFSPEHFLDSDGAFRKRDAFLPFSAGLSYTFFVNTQFPRL